MTSTCINHHIGWTLMTKLEERGETWLTFSASTTTSDGLYQNRRAGRNVSDILVHQPHHPCHVAVQKYFVSATILKSAFGTRCHTEGLRKRLTKTIFVPGSSECQNGFVVLYLCVRERENAPNYRASCMRSCVYWDMGCLVRGVHFNHPSPKTPEFW